MWIVTLPDVTNHFWLNCSQNPIVVTSLTFSTDCRTVCATVSISLMPPAICHVIIHRAKNRCNEKDTIVPPDHVLSIDSTIQQSVRHNQFWKIHVEEKKYPPKLRDTTNTYIYKETRATSMLSTIPSTSTPYASTRATLPVLHTSGLHMVISGCV